ncbi:uncharacterized protein LOC121781980 [Salvia splendens]|uniref:uncharacterized protein LOC121781980 n=1 Tax=Salvia splendens TaxID=180675 RepID=UPI001C26D589|nr:uncharacterized protein LOC121781980 [Salvia splendens]
MAPPTPDDVFGLYIHHGGHFFTPNGKFQKYIGGGMAQASDLDPDRFGYFDLVEEFNKIGIDTWGRLTFVNHMSATHVNIKSDKEVMEMLSATLRDSFNRMCSIYVVDGRKSTEGMGSEHVGEKVVKKVETVNNSKSVVEKSNFESATKIRNSTSISKGKSVIEKNVEKAVVKSVEKRVVESVSKNVAISFGRSGSERVVKSTEKQGSERVYKSTEKQA